MNSSKMIDLDRLAYKVQMIKYSKDGGHAEFFFRVLGPNQISFHVIDRYSSMRQFQSLLKKDLDDSVNLGDLPAFPKKRYVGSLEDAFLEQRMGSLGQFFNSFLSNKEVASNKLVLTYFASKAADQESQDSIVKLNEAIQ